MPVYLVVPELDAFCVTVEVLVSDTILWTKAVSDWKSDLFASRSLENGEGFKEPSKIGFMNRGQRRRHTERKDRISRPECLDNESQTAEQYLDQTSFVSLGSSGLGVVREMIWRSSGLV